MPYIERNQRNEIDPAIEGLIKSIKYVNNKRMDKGAGHTVGKAGMMNYAFTRLATAMFPDRSYWIFALVIGVFVTAALEYYRRLVVPYEERKAEENGDVYEI